MAEDQVILVDARDRLWVATEGGGVADVPAELLHTLNEGGRLVVVLGQKRLMHATLISRKGNEYPREMLFETSVPALVEEQQLQKAEFEF